MTTPFGVDQLDHAGINVRRRGSDPRDGVAFWRIDADMGGPVGMERTPLLCRRDGVEGFHGSDHRRMTAARA